jgi:hypothetical protein
MCKYAELYKAHLYFISENYLWCLEPALEWEPRSFPEAHRKWANNKNVQVIVIRKTY